MKNVEAHISSAFYNYMDAYFNKRDLQQTLHLLHQDAIGFGTGCDEAAYSFHELEKLYRRDFAQAPNKVDVEYHQQKIVVMNETTGLVSSQFTIRSTIDGQPFALECLRSTNIFIYEQQHWQMVYLHLSLPAREHQDGESYPVRELQERNRILQQMVAEKTTELVQQNREMQNALANVKQLRGLLPICASCKKIRDDDGYWHEVTTYLRNHSDAEFSHGICPECAQLLYPEDVKVRNE